MNYLLALTQFVGFFAVAPYIGNLFWPSLIEFQHAHSLSDVQLVLIVQIVWHTFILLFANLCWCLVYKAKLATFEKHKINNAPWPWEESPKQWNSFFKKSLLLVGFNSLVVLPFVTITASFLKGFKTEFNLHPDQIPSGFHIFLQCLFNFLLEDFLFHLSHRLLHWKYLYPYIHKVHHKYRVSVSIAAEFAHPADYIITSLLPSSAGSILMESKMHLFTQMVWYVVRITETAEGHSGYDLPWSPFRVLPFTTSPAYHDFHHYENTGNYSSAFRHWDTFFGTNKSYYRY